MPAREVYLSKNIFLWQINWNSKQKSFILLFSLFDLFKLDSKLPPFWKLYHLN